MLYQIYKCLVHCSPMVVKSSSILLQLHCNLPLLPSIVDLKDLNKVGLSLFSPSLFYSVSLTSPSKVILMLALIHHLPTT